MRSIAAKLTITYAVSLLAILAVVFFAGFRLLENQMIEASRAIVDNEYGRVRNHLRQGPPSTAPEVLEKRLRKLTDNAAKLLYVEVRHIDGRTLFKSRNLRNQNLPAETAERFETTLAHGGKILVSRYDLAPYYRILIATSSHPVLIAMRSYVEIVIALVVLTVVLGATCGYLMSQVSLRPLRTIRETCERIGLDTLDERIPVPPVKDEISALAKLLNEMFDRLDASVEEMRRFTGDASHELKTPLALMRLHVDKLLLDTGMSAESRAAVQELDEDMTHLQQTIGGLLLLSRLDSKTLPVEIQLQPVDTFLDGIRSDAAALVEHHGSRFVLVKSGSGQAIFDPRWIRQVLLNLLTNALNASNAGSVVMLESIVGPEGWRVSVHDQGRGLPKEQHERIFDRFVRASNDGEGCGLGLAVCRSVIDLHGGSIVAQTGPNEVGLTVSFTVPTRDSQARLAPGPKARAVRRVASPRVERPAAA